MTLFGNLSASFKYLDTAMKTMPMKKLTMEHVPTHLMHKMSKNKEKELQNEDTTMVLQKNKGGNSFPSQSAKSCFYYGKPDHIARFCSKTKNKQQNNAKNTKNDDDYTFVMRDDTHFNSIYI